MVLLLSQPQGWTVAQLARRLNVSRTRLYQDIAVLRRAGIRVRRTRSGCTIAPPPLPLAAELTQEEILALVLPSDLFAADRRPTTTEQARAKLLLRLPEQLRRWVAKVLERTYVDTESTTREGKLFGLLQRAVAEQTSIRIDYFSLRSLSRSWRTVDPYGLVYRSHSWYLVGFCHLRGEIRRFRVSRIHDVQMTDATFAYPKGFSPEECFAGSWKAFGGRNYEVAVKFSSRIGPLIRERAVRPGQHILTFSDGSVLLRATVRGLDEIAWWLVQYGSDAVVLEPEALRRKVCDLARGILQANRVPLSADRVAAGKA